MPQSYAGIYIHFVWSTKLRQPLLPKAVHAELFRYIGGIVKDKKSKLLCAGGMEDHVHLLISLGREIDVSTLAREIKTNSSHWLKAKLGDTFAWQDGFGAFSVSASNLEKVTRYIENQEADHHRVTFEEEFELFLEQYRVEYDPKFLWRNSALAGLRMLTHPQSLFGWQFQGARHWDRCRRRQIRYRFSFGKDR